MSKTPFGTRAPMDLKRSGDSRKSLISEISSTASSSPATSAKVTLGESGVSWRACALRMFINPP